jgi:C1A family cysteine protease
MSLFLSLEEVSRERCVSSPVRDQGQQGSCTSFAITALREFLEIKNGTPDPWIQLSPAFEYYQERQLEKTVSDCQAGAMIRDDLKVLKKPGVCSEAGHPPSVPAFERRLVPLCVSV